MTKPNRFTEKLAAQTRTRAPAQEHLTDDTAPKPVASPRKKLTVDLDAGRFEDLALAAVRAGVSKVEIIRALLDEYNTNPDVASAVGERLAAGTVHRPKGFEARPELAAEARRSRTQVS